MKAKAIAPIEDMKILANMPQTVKVRNHLIRYGSITPQEAWREYGITRLADVVYKLKYKRHPLMDIGTLMIYYTDEYGRHRQYAKYIFDGGYIK